MELAKKGLNDGETIQIRTLATAFSKERGIAFKEAKAQVIKLLRRAGISKSVTGKPIYGTQKVLIADAERALAKAALPPVPLDTPSVTARLDTLRTASDAVLAQVPAPAPQGGTGDLETDPVDESAFIEDAARDTGGFPPVPNLPAEYVHLFVNRSPARVMHFHQRGWRAPTNPATLLKWDPSGLLLKKRLADGRVYHEDTVLMVLPRKIWNARQAARSTFRSDRSAEVVETFHENITEAQRQLHDQHGLKGSEHVASIHLEDDEIQDRAKFSKAKKAGAPPKAFTDLASRGTRT